jgi:hypothetical protein
MPPLTPLDILFVVLAFCVLWLSAAFFWLIWQVGSVLRNVNDTLETVQQKVVVIESAITAVRHRFENMTSLAGPLIDAGRRVVEYAMEKREDMKAARKAPPSRRSPKVALDEDLMD